MSIDFHYVPENRPVSYIDHWLRSKLSFFPKASSQAPAQYFHSEFTSVQIFPIDISNFHLPAGRGLQILREDDAFHDLL